MTTPLVPFGRFLASISSLLNKRTSIFKPSILFTFGFSIAGFCALKSSEVSNLPRIISFVISRLFLQTLTITFFPTSVSATILGSSFISLIGFPSNSKIISPGLIPPLSDGLLSATLATKAPLGLSSFSASAIPWSTTWILTPSHPLFVSPNSINWSITFWALLDGIANPIPIDPDCPSIAVLIPMTSPFILNSGPPEFPWFIEASVWI